MQIPIAGRRLALLTLATLALATPAPAQFGGGPEGPKLKSPVANQVFQRDDAGYATIALVAPEGAGDFKVVNASISAVGNPAGLSTVKFADGVFSRVPAGGPYFISIEYRKGETAYVARVGPVFVGDLWVLAGQSNMEGVGNLRDVTPPNDRVMLLGMDGAWTRAEEPLHWLVDSPDPVHSGDPNTRAERSAAQHKSRGKGAGLGLPFAEAMVKATNVPVGLVACAHGGTSMAQWDPAKKGEGGNSLYGSMIRQVELAGGKVRGVLWYQGESDAFGGPAVFGAFPKVFTDFIAAVRADLGRSDLPFYYVQIGRVIMPADVAGWDAVREAQRTLPAQVPNTGVVSAVDLELDDLIHVGTQGLKRLGRRLANLALHDLAWPTGATTPTFGRVVNGGTHQLVVKFADVNQGSADGLAPGLQPARRVTGFSIRGADGATLPIIFEAAVGQARNTVVLKLTGPVPEKATLWYGQGLDPHCNLVDGRDMAVPAFGPIPLDGLK